MRNRLLFSMLPGSKEYTPSFIRQKYRPTLLFLTVFCGEDFLVDTGYHKPIGITGAQFFHEILR